MQFIEKIIELIPLEKEHLIPILIGIVISGTVGGGFYVNSLFVKIENMETILKQQKENNEKNVLILQDMIKEQKDHSEFILKEYGKIHAIQIKHAESVAKARADVEMYKQLLSTKLKKSKSKSK